MTKLLISFCICIVWTFCEAQIPYSYSSGRDLAAVNQRFQNFNDAKANGADISQINAICGKVSPIAACGKNNPLGIGRPREDGSLNCDSACCHLGFKAGNCVSDSSFGTAISSAAASVDSIPTPTLGNCRCVNGDIDVKCGPDGSTGGIRCPFDKSACWRKCCRQGKSGGSCRRFLKTKCVCD